MLWEWLCGIRSLIAFRMCAVQTCDRCKSFTFIHNPSNFSSAEHHFTSGNYIVCNFFVDRIFLFLARRPCAPALSEATLGCARIPAGHCVSLFAGAHDARTTAAANSIYGCFACAPTVRPGHVVQIDISLLWLPGDCRRMKSGGRIK